MNWVKEHELAHDQIRHARNWTAVNPGRKMVAVNPGRHCRYEIYDAPEWRPALQETEGDTAVYPSGSTGL